MSDVYNILGLKRGDTWDGVQFTITVDGTPLDLTSTSINMQVRKKLNSDTVELTLSDGSGITKTDAANGVFVIDPIIITLEEGNYVYDIEFTTGVVVKTYVQGKITVVETVTR